MLMPLNSHALTSSPVEILENENVLLEPSKEGRCWTELKSSVMLKWGERSGVWEADIEAGVEIGGEEIDWRYRSVPSFVEIICRRRWRRGDKRGFEGEAGVEDPHWILPPGWSLGDNLTQDSVCAVEFKLLKEAMAKMERNMQELLFKKQEDDVAVVNTQSSCNTSQNFDHDNFLLPLKEMYTNLMNKKAKIKEQMMEVSHSLCEMEVFNY
ncbi:hypothetical protein Patl1_19821 [Pistacia atlantica]|uniref:Uncharacterized protein n=1 Tax=Pistacia atlantica TaxID=434234 RepID=A0ACC1BM47_9ROSI|nr:hypothetical protein Patl1_19821 [Pistacia atlantica]